MTKDTGQLFISKIGKITWEIEFHFEVEFTLNMLIIITITDIINFILIFYFNEFLIIII